MEVNTISGDKSIMIESVLLNVKEEPNINNYLPISDTYVESSHVSPMDHSRDGAKPVFKDIAKNYVEIKYDFSKNSPPPLIKIKEEPIESGNTYPAPCHVETGNLHFVEIEDHSGKISRSDDNIFDQNVVIKEEEDITDVFTEDINGLGSSQNLQSNEEDITNQLNNQHVVYIKQEVNINSDSEGNMVDSSTPDDIQEDHSFGQHFLTRVSDPKKKARQQKYRERKREELNQRHRERRQRQRNANISADLSASSNIAAESENLPALEGLQNPFVERTEGYRNQAGTNEVKIINKVSDPKKRARQQKYRDRKREELNQRRREKRQRQRIANISADSSASFNIAAEYENLPALEGIQNPFVVTTEGYRNQADANEVKIINKVSDPKKRARQQKYRDRKREELNQRRRERRQCQHNAHITAHSSASFNR